MARLIEKLTEVDSVSQLPLGSGSYCGPQVLLACVILSLVARIKHKIVSK